jgi:hypothetical protein
LQGVWNWHYGKVDSTITIESDKITFKAVNFAGITLAYFYVHNQAEHTFILQNISSLLSDANQSQWWYDILENGNTLVLYPCPDQIGIITNEMIKTYNADSSTTPKYPYDMLATFEDRMKDEVDNRQIMPLAAYFGEVYTRVN